jgi:eukaryotic-like serine/threonine-protein kinase
LNRYDEARAIADQAIAQKIDPWSIHITTYHLAYLRGDEDTMRKELDAAVGHPQEPVLLLIQADGICAQGKIKQAREAYARALSTAQAKGLKEYGATILSFEAQCDLAAGFLPEAGQQIAASLAHSDDRNARSGAAYVFARLGDAARAQKLVDDLVKDSPTDTLLNQVLVPLVHANISLQHNQPAQALTQLEPSTPYELGVGRGRAFRIMSDWGEAYLRSHDGAKAAAEYQKILDHRGLDTTSVLYSLAHLGLGRAYTLQGDTAKAKTAYQDFFAAWKDADADVPILKTGKAEYEKLK